MAEEIKDGTGTGNRVKITSDNRMDVSSKSNPRPYYVSRDKGLVFNCTSDYTPSAAGEYVFYIKNTSSTKILFLHGIEYHSVENVKWKVFQVDGTASGTTLTPANLNLGSGLPAEALCLGNAAITGINTIAQIGTHRTQALGEAGMEFSDALILTPGTAVSVEYDTGTVGNMELDVFFYFEDII